MKRFFLMMLAALCAAAIALAAPGPQAGPAQKDTARRDSTKTEATPKPAKKKAPATPAKETGRKAGSAKAPAKGGGSAQHGTKADTTRKAPPAKAQPRRAAPKKASPQKAPPAKAQPQKATPKKAPPQKAQPVKAESQPGMRPVPASGHIKRAVFTTGIQNHEPIDTVDSLRAPAEKIYFFTEIVGMPGQTVTCRWMYGGQVKAEVPIAVRSPRWRAYSSKDLLPGWSGEWTVQVVDSTGTVLDTSHFVYTGAGPTNRGVE